MKKKFFTPLPKSRTTLKRVCSPMPLKPLTRITAVRAFGLYRGLRRFAAPPRWFSVRVTSTTSTRPSRCVSCFCVRA